MRKVDVAIIGAGTAGLTAAKEVLKLTKNVLVIDRGPLGTTCSRVGCMPSKVLLQVAHDYARIKTLSAQGVWQGEGLLNIPQTLIHVRSLRDHFVGFVLRDIRELEGRFLGGQARFLGPNRLIVDDKIEIEAKSIIVATGSSPVVPKEWEAYKDKILTTDSFFELPDLPQSWGVIGLGAIGLEMGQALARLDRDVVGFDRNPMLGGLKDQLVSAKALQYLSEDFPIHLGADVKLSQKGSKMVIDLGETQHEVDRILAAVGRRPNLQGLDLAKTNCELDDHGVPLFDPHSMQIKGSAGGLFIAGDVDGDRKILHEAADDGRIAGHNAATRDPIRFKRKTKLGITFTSPNLASIGEAMTDLAQAVSGEASFETQGRSLIMGENRGLLRLYADRKTGQLLGAELAAPAGEHLAHLISAAIAERLSVQKMLQHTFYHPTVEEGLRTALRDVRKKLDLPLLPGPDFEPMLSV